MINSIAMMDFYHLAKQKELNIKWVMFLMRKTYH